MSPQQVQLVKSNFATLSRYPLGIGLMFYLRLFAANKHLKPLFKGEIADQAQALAGIMRLIVQSLDEPGRFVPSIYALGWLHARLGIDEADYDALGDALVQTVDDAVPTRTSDELRAAWRASFERIATVMKEAANDAACGRPPRFPVCSTGAA